MSFLRLHRLSVLWKNWMFNQEPEHVFQVENSKDNEESILQREVPLRQSRRRFRKINQRGERQTITDNVDASSYLSVSLLPVCHLSGSVLLGLGTLRKAVRRDEMGCACRSCGRSFLSALEWSTSCRSEDSGCGLKRGYLLYGCLIERCK